MRIKGVAMMVLAAALSAAAPAGADNNPNGTVFRATGWFRGEAEISEGSIRCEVPTINSGISEGAFSMGLWNTYGEPFLMFPDANSAFGNPCGGFLSVQSNLLDQALNVEKIKVTYRIAGAKQFRQFVPTRNGFPIACRPFRKQTLFVAARLNPVNSSEDLVSGAPNVALIQMLPLVNTGLVNCLRSQYAPLPTDVLSALTLRITATAVGTSDAGETYRANPLAYNLTLRHTCGNGRVDDGELCDPAAPDTCRGFCVVAAGESTGICSHNEAVVCRNDFDCFGVCTDGGNPSECLCIY